MTSIQPYIKAGYPALYLVSHEEQRMEALVLAVAEELERNLYAWSCTAGIMAVISSTINPGTTIEADPFGVLDEIAKLPEKTIILIRDFHLYFENPEPGLLRKFKDALYHAKTKEKTILLLSAVLKLPPEIEKLVTVVEIDLPDRDTLTSVLKNLADSADVSLPAGGDIAELVGAASGLTTTEAEDAFSLSVVETGGFDPKIISREKAQTVKKSGLLEFVESPITLDDIGGLDHLKSWMLKRRAAFSPEARAYGLPMPKGALVVGPPGTGKSLTSKACAAALGGIPLLKLDAGSIFGSLVGESERNLRTITKTAEAIAPCVLWIDEVEKGFSGGKSSGSTDGGTSARVLGSFLQWMNDKTAPVFVMATANDVTGIPAEFLRKGRFDEMWFVDLPTASERADIWSVVSRRYGRDLETIASIADLVAATDGFTGAEIDALFAEALFNAFDGGGEPTAQHLGAAIAATTPLSKTRAEDIAAIRDWASTRARRASPEETSTAVLPGSKVTRKITR